jgi:hypothetical protein
VKYPNFFVVGANKAGTTALHGALRQHPAIFMSEVKEPLYWGCSYGELCELPGGIRSRSHRRMSDAAYADLFAEADDAGAIGEACADNLFSPTAAMRIREALPHAKLIVILREPVDRAYSAYCYARYTVGVEACRRFAAVMTPESECERRNCWPVFQYRAGGFYSRQLHRYLERFPRHQVHVELYENWRDRPRATLARIFRFLDVDPEFMPRIERQNVSRGARNEALHQAQVRLRLRLQSGEGFVSKRLFSLMPLAAQLGNKLNRADPPALDSALRAQLQGDYREDLLRLQDLLGKSLDAWLK